MANWTEEDTLLGDCIITGLLGIVAAFGIAYFTAKDIKQEMRMKEDSVYRERILQERRVDSISEWRYFIR